MTFNPGPKSTSAKVIFSHKIKKTSNPHVNFNNNPVKQGQFQKHLRYVYLDGKLDLYEYLQNMLKKINKTIRLIT